MQSRYPRSAHEQMRDAVLDAAAERVIGRGWSNLRIQAIARQAEVSRQTIYTTFGGKRGIAQALVLRLTERFVAGIEDAMAGHADLHQQWYAGMYYALDRAAHEPLLVTVLTGDGDDEFLPLLTSRGAPVVDVSRTRLGAVLRDTCPDLDATTTDDVAEAAVRLALSHIVLPLRPAEQVATQIARIVEATCRAGSRAPAGRDT